MNTLMPEQELITEEYNRLQNSQPQDKNEKSFIGTLKTLQIFLIYLTAFLAPLFYLPFTPDPLFGKQTLVITLIILALIFQLIRSLMAKEFICSSGIVTVALGLVLAVLFLSSIFSLSPRHSFFAPDTLGERFITFASFTVFAFLIALEFSRKNLMRLIEVLLASGLILSLFIFINTSGLFSLPAVLQLNPVGSLNNGAAVLIVFSMMSLGLIIFRDSVSRYSKIAAWLVAVISAIDLMLINFKMGWIALAAFSIFFIILYSSRVLRKSSPGEDKTLAFLNLIFITILGASVLLTAFSIPAVRVFPNLKSELEVMPSAGTTISIGLKALKTNPLLGTGPGTFIYNYDRFKLQAINQTIFWNVKFTQGFSFLTTIISNLGILGILAFLFLIGALLYTLIIFIWRINYVGSLEFAAMSPVILGLIFWAIHPSNFVMNFLLFLGIGAWLVATADSYETAPSLQPFRRHKIEVNTKILYFLATFSIIAVIFIAILPVFYLIRKYIAEIYFARGNIEFIQNGNTATAVSKYASAISFDPNDDRYYINQSQAYLSLAQSALSRTVTEGAGAQKEFQDNLNAAIEAGRRATTIDPNNSEAWLTLGMAYEIAMPFVDGADQLAITNYTQAAKYNPNNPIPLTLLGRTYLEIFDRIDLRARQDAAVAKNAAELKKTALENAKSNLRNATELKSDYATAQFLLAQASIREGDIDEAIRRGIQTAIIAPNDVGVAFFLGFLFYQKGDLINAEQQFSRAVLINPNYSNAMYFLGLIYDRTQRPGEALKQFRRVLELNPDNEEVRMIVNNLESGRPALSTITPPPEKRNEPPIKENTDKIQKTKNKTGR